MTGRNLHRIHYRLCQCIFGHGARFELLSSSMLFDYERCCHVYLSNVREARSWSVTFQLHIGDIIKVLPLDLMLRKPRNARTSRLTDWRFFFQIYLVRHTFYLRVNGVNLKVTVHGIDDVALRNVYVVLLHASTRVTIL